MRHFWGLSLASVGETLLSLSFYVHGAAGLLDLYVLLFSGLSYSNSVGVWTDVTLDELWSSIGLMVWSLVLWGFQTQVITGPRVASTVVCRADASCLEIGKHIFIVIGWTIIFSTIIIFSFYSLFGNDIILFQFSSFQSNIRNAAWVRSIFQWCCR